MPLVRIDLLEGKSAEYGKEVGQIVNRALTEVMNAPKDDLFQVTRVAPLRRHRVILLPTAGRPARGVEG